MTSYTVTGLELSAYDLKEWDSFIGWLSINKSESWEADGKAEIINPTEWWISWLWGMIAKGEESKSIDDGGLSGGGYTFYDGIAGGWDCSKTKYSGKHYCRRETS